MFCLCLASSLWVLTSSRAYKDPTARRQIKKWIVLCNASVEGCPNYGPLWVPHMYMNVCTHTHIYIYIYIHMDYSLPIGPPPLRGLSPGIEPAALWLGIPQKQSSLI